MITRRFARAAWLALAVVVAALGTFIAVPVTASAAVTTTLTNFTPDDRQATRFDTAGNPVDAHDGMIAQFGGSYYLYGTSYDCGYQWQYNRDFCGFKVYSSPDLAHWTDRGYVATPRQCTYCFRPHVVYNAQTHRYVMWVNDQDALDNFRVYTAPTPIGPFTEAPVPDLPSATPCTADLGLFVDADGTGYLTCSNAGWHIAVIKLTPDYLQPTDQWSVVGVTKVEAPSLFERDGTYYLTMSDPNCGYCAATGTSYVTAPTPLGPWHGTDAWTVTDGVLQVRGGLYGLSKEGADWTDYTFSADVAPQPEIGSTTTVQAGWSVRMSSSDKGYLFLLHGTPTSAGKLDVLVRNGATVQGHTVTLPYPVAAGAWHHVSVTASGSTIMTSIDGVQVDSFTDSTYPTGGVGFREYRGAAVEVGYFDNAKVVAADGTTLLSDDFSSDDLTQWVAPLAGTKISTDSCGGQPSFVTQLTGADGSAIYLYASDLWDFHTNEGLANYYWEPLRFDADGSIQPLRCDNGSVALAGSSASVPPAPGEDQSSGGAAFSPSCVVSAGHSYGQTFTAGRSGPLTSLAVNVYRDGAEVGRVLRNPPTAPLSVRLASVQADGTVGATLWATSVASERIGWSARQLLVRPLVPVVRGERLAIVLSTDSLQGCYGLEIDPTDPYPGGSALAGGDQLNAVAGTDVRFTTTVGNDGWTPPRLDPHADVAILGPASGDVPVLATGDTPAVVWIANLTHHAVTIPVRVSVSRGYSTHVEPTATVDVGQTVPVVVNVGRSRSAPASGTFTVTAASGTLTVPTTATDDIVRTAVMGASSTHTGWHPARTNDGQTGAQTDDAAWNAGAGWNDNDKGGWPDTLSAMWPAPVTLSRVEVLTLDAPDAPAASNGLRDYDVQAFVDGAWTTVASVRGNTLGTIVSSFPRVTTSALRLLITDSNDHGYSRVVELEAYAG